MFDGQPELGAAPAAAAPTSATVQPAGVPPQEVGTQIAEVPPDAPFFLEFPDGSRRVATTRQMADAYIAAQQPSGTGGKQSFPETDNDRETYDNWKKAVAGDKGAMQKLMDLWVPDGKTAPPSPAAQTPNELAEIKAELARVRQELNGSKAVTNRIEELTVRNQIASDVQKNAAKLPWLASHPNSAGLVQEAERTVREHVFRTYGTLDVEKIPFAQQAHVRETLRVAPFLLAENKVRETAQAFGVNDPPSAKKAAATATPTTSVIDDRSALSADRPTQRFHIQGGRIVDTANRQYAQGPDGQAHVISSEPVNTANLPMQAPANGQAKPIDSPEALRNFMRGVLANKAGGPS